MIQCRYVGSDECSIGEREFSRIGEVAMFSEALFKDAVMGGGAFIPETYFRGMFSPEELDAWGSIDDRDLAPSSFVEKLERAQQLFRELRHNFAAKNFSAISEVSEAGILADA